VNNLVGQSVKLIHQIGSNPCITGEIVAFMPNLYMGKYYRPYCIRFDDGRHNNYSRNDFILIGEYDNGQRTDI